MKYEMSKRNFNLLKMKPLLFSFLLPNSLLGSSCSLSFPSSKTTACRFSNNLGGPIGNVAQLDEFNPQVLSKGTIIYYDIVVVVVGYCGCC